MANPRFDLLDALARIRKHLSDLLLTTPDARKPVAKILALLDPIERDLRQDGAAGGSKSIMRRGGSVSHYTIEMHGPGRVLAEYRHNASSPLRCPRAVYDATAGTLMDCPPNGLTYEETLKAVRARLGREIADYLPRICLRFWAGADVALVFRSRLRYRPMDQASFVLKATHAWETLEKKPTDMGPPQ